MLGKPRILSLFRNNFDKFNNTGAQTLDSIYHMTFKLIKNTFWRENVKILLSLAQRYNGRQYVAKPLGLVVYRFYCNGVISLPVRKPRRSTLKKKKYISL